MVMKARTQRASRADRSDGNDGDAILADVVGRRDDAQTRGLAGLRSLDGHSADRLEPILEFRIDESSAVGHDRFVFPFGRM